ncbi:Na+/H+ antiporter subunit E [Falsiroseomonas tokyonensis]|uniref:Na+/H+ antiporter subunit E n=1 Tax=Falsiroseomonas tokyonensis TaxID=430521 RepID=A0ABV7BW93_9PROT|nr:Na+/H+ antiporter subunit E [Falsiroseomonas tokyonensis]MBU8539144.1 Na+/H+ antiporter subunit E [Falsiroseomonas tokyonensis]
MRRLLPFPVFAVSLAALWLLLVGSVKPGSLLLAAGFGLAGGWMLVSLTPPDGRLRRLAGIPRLLGLVLVEVLRSNADVARIILRRGGWQPRRSGFVRVRLQMRSPYGLAALACILTTTPGTVWVEYDSVENTMLLHVLDLIDEEAWVGIIKDRWEARLMEIFE